MNEIPFNPKAPINVIIINGSGGSGKSTFCQLCKDFCINKIVSEKIPFPVVTELSTIDYVKTIAKETGWDGNKDEKGRAYLSALKDAMEDYNSLASRKVIEIIISSRKFIQAKVSTKMKTDENEDDPYYFLKYLFFVNIREPERIEKFQELCMELNIPCHTALVTNKNVPVITSNHADANVLDYSYDWYICNDLDLEALKETIETFMLEVLRYDTLTP